jgi:hypothetical protein
MNKRIMEDGEGKIEVDEINLRFCLIHEFYIIIPCGFIKLLRVYKIGKEENKSNKMTIMGVEHVIVFLNLFTYYEQDMAKYIIFFDYYNNVY